MGDERGPRVPTAESPTSAGTVALRVAGEPHESVLVGGTVVRGVDVDDETRCAHYRSDRDVVAVEFACCGTVYPCFQCHAALADHEAVPRPASAHGERAVLCGACGGRLAIDAYLDRLVAAPSCPDCGAAFNPGCLDHRERYFEG